MNSQRTRGVQLAAILTVLSLSMAARADILFVANPGDSTIHRFSTTGADLGGFSSVGIEPVGVALDASGNLYVSTFGDNSIHKFSPTGTDLGVFASTGLLRPSAMVFDAHGSMYVDNFNFTNGYVEKFSPAGTDLGSVVSGIATQILMGMDSSGHLLVNIYTSNTIEKYSTTGVDLGLFAVASGGSQGMALDHHGNVYVALPGNNQVQEFSPTGADLGIFASTGLDVPRDLAFDSAGNLYVTNEGNNTIREFSPSGVDLGNFATAGLNEPYGLVIATPTATVPEPSTFGVLVIGGTWVLAVASGQRIESKRHRSPAPTLSSSS